MFWWARGVLRAMPVAALAWRGVLVAEIAHLGSCILFTTTAMAVDKVCAFCSIVGKRSGVKGTTPLR